jgi:hypothetical protein
MKIDDFHLGWWVASLVDGGSLRWWVDLDDSVTYKSERKLD